AEGVTIDFEQAWSRGRFSLAEQEYVDQETFITVRLREELEKGPQERIDLDLFMEHCSEERLYRAADRLGVIKIKEGWKGAWVWMLPEHFPAWEAERAKRREEEARERRKRRKKLKADSRRRRRKTAAK